MLLESLVVLYIVSLLLSVLTADIGSASNVAPNVVGGENLGLVRGELGSSSLRAR